LLAGYTLYYGLVGADTTAIDIGDQTSYHITGLTPGRLYGFMVRAYDISGNKSDSSQELHYRVPYAGEVVYIPHPNFHGTDSFTYRAIDAAGASVVGIASVTVNPVNDVPLVVKQEVLTQEDTPVTIDNVLANAVDVDGDSLQIISFTPAAYGIVVENGDGTFTYSPPSNFHGMDHFTYVVSDGNGGSATGTVVIHVMPVNDAPVASALSLSTLEDEPMTLPPQWPASDADADVLTLMDFTPPAHGHIVVHSDGAVQYVPDADFSGADSFTYTVSDGRGGTATGVVTLTVTAQNDPPRARDDLGRTAEDVPTVIDVLANDMDVEGDAFQIIAVTSPAHGTVSDNGDGTFTYTPQADFHGVDSFTYTIAESSGLAATATVTVTVTPVNDPPVAEPQHVMTAAERPVALTLVGHDIDGDPLTFIIETPPTHGTLSGMPPLVTYTPARDFQGTDSLTFRVDDGTASSPAVLVSLLVTATTLVNGGFESGDFTAWTTLGEARLETGAYGSGPTEGTFQALLLTAGPVEEAGDTTGGAVPVGALETFLGLPPGSLDSLSTSPVVEGSAIKRTVTVQAGTVLSFAWNFLTNEVTNLDELAVLPNPDANDLVFVTLTPLTLVADTFWTFVLSPADFVGETGFTTFTVTLPTTGTYTLGLGVVDVGDATGLSGLLLDHFTLTPPTSP
jgi:hypothetical protein